jgi:hypothetical protein
LEKPSILGIKVDGRNLFCLQAEGHRILFENPEANLGVLVWALLNKSNRLNPERICDKG